MRQLEVDDGFGQRRRPYERRLLALVRRQFEPLEGGLVHRAVGRLRRLAEGGLALRPEQERRVEDAVGSSVPTLLGEKRVGGGDVGHRLARQHEDADARSEVALNAHFDGGGERVRRLVVPGLEDRVTALQVGADVRKAEPLEQGAQVGHRQLGAADVDCSQKGDVRTHPLLLTRSF